MLRVAGLPLRDSMDNVSQPSWSRRSRRSRRSEQDALNAQGSIYVGTRMSLPFVTMRV